MDDEDRRRETIKSATRDFVGLNRSEAEKLAAALGLHPTVLDWDVLGEEPVALAFPTRDDGIILHLKGGMVTRAEAR